jgi:pSer/pThr/pTyr-binding forkhead associated (FHA) protein
VNIDVGTTIGGYRLDQLIGQGGMGVVYLGTSEQTGQRAAVKLLTPDLARQSGFRERFVREARYANSLNHPNVIEVYDAGEQDGVLYIVMQLVEGYDLKNVLSQQGALEPARAVRLMGQVASALDTAHAMGLLHRDIKPGNVMIVPGEPEHAYLTDFGLSKNVSSDSIALTAQGEFVGTIDYTAPELVLGKESDSRLDVYSLGCLFFECLAGQPPFNKERDVEVLYAHIQDPPPKITEKRSDVPPELDDVIAKAMAKKPEDRYATATEFINAAGAVVGEPAAGPPPPPPPPPPPAPAAGAPAAATPAPTPTPSPQPEAGELPYPASTLVMRVTGGNAAGTVISVGEDEFLIGRQAPGDGKLGNDIEISRRHARVTREADGRFLIEDLGSTNGTWVNGERVATQPLKPHDVIEMGDTRLLVLHPAEAPEMDEPAQPAGPAGVTTFASVPEEPTAEVPPDATPPPQPVVPEPEAEPEPEPVPAAGPQGVTTFAEVPADLPAEPEPAVAADEEPVAVPGDAPAGAASAEPVPAEPVTPRGQISVRLEVDMDTGEVSVHVDDPDGPARFVKRADGWTVDT